ncbi:hypothetical protein C0J52_17623 [Blattella germanica]|nr:hypothetical protein C0J52_17623 [Blattella germanica]
MYGCRLSKICLSCFHKHGFEDGPTGKDGMEPQDIILHVWLQTIIDRSTCHVFTNMVLKTEQQRMELNKGPFFTKEIFANQ